MSPQSERAPAVEGLARRRSRPRADDTILTDSSVSRREDHRQRQLRRLVIAREAERLMPLAYYYRHHGGPLLAVPIGEYYVGGRWAA